MRLIAPSIRTIRLENKPVELIAEIARTAYQAEFGNDLKLVRSLIRKNHGATLEFTDATFRIVCDRGISHELVRHRLASFCQESTRYCNYFKAKFGSQLTFIKPPFEFEASKFEWGLLMQRIETYYNRMIERGEKPQIARAILPNCLKAEIVVKMNLRCWRNFFKLRCAPTAHPQMQEVAWMIVDQFHRGWELKPHIINLLIGINHVTWAQRNKS